MCVNKMEMQTTIAVDHFYIALFSTLKQTHYNSEQVIVPLISAVCSGVLTALHHCYMAGAT